ncbi:LPXTG cell wall anchor domain-containing protein [Kitasatospora sp. NPDC088351]|uniref:LPXTG cell wall anchor domain-containing protein n=1 Tax=Kitasatospora sp. NPDC088351 TaxID=3155180 RepID=UPI0034431092
MTVRTSRLLAASTLLVLTVGATATGTAAALAADASPNPTATATATAGPSATASPSATATAGPSATATATTTATATATQSPGSPSTIPGCPEGVTQSPMPATVTGPAGVLVPGGEAQEITAVFENSSTATIGQLATALTLTAQGDAGTVPADSFDLRLRAPGSDWKPVRLTGKPLDTGTFQLARGEKLTLQLRIAADPKAPLGQYRFAFAALTEPLPSGSAPARKYTCPQLTGSATGTLMVADRAPATGATTPASTGPATTPPAAHLADTGAGTGTRPIALTGAAALALGAALLFLARRRPRTDV